MALQLDTTDYVGGAHHEAYVRIMLPAFDVASSEIRQTYYWYHNKAWAKADKAPFRVNTYSIPLAKLL